MSVCKSCLRDFSETQNRIIDGETVTVTIEHCRACQGLSRESKRRVAINLAKFESGGVYNLHGRLMVGVPNEPRYTNEDMHTIHRNATSRNGRRVYIATNVA